MLLEKCGPCRKGDPTASILEKMIYSDSHPEAREIIADVMLAHCNAEMALNRIGGPGLQLPFCNAQVAQPCYPGVISAAGTKPCGCVPGSTQQLIRLPAMRGHACADDHLPFPLSYACDAHLRQVLWLKQEDQLFAHVIQQPQPPIRHIKNWRWSAMEHRPIFVSYVVQGGEHPAKFTPEPSNFELV